MASRSYKDLNLYSCIVLNLLSSAMELDLSQKDLVEKIDLILNKRKVGLSKSEIMHHIRSNHNMTSKILDHLLDQGFIDIEQSERGYSIFPTKEGLLHVGEFNRFYASIYGSQIEEHYRYMGLPSWYRTFRGR